MTTLADKSLLSGGDNKPPMLEKHLYDSWKSRMELYMLNRPHGRMILASVEKGPLVWPSITEDGVTRLKEYIELTPAEAIQADCDIKAINIILQGLPTEIYALEVNIEGQTTYALNKQDKYTPGASGSNTGKQRTIICYNCKGEGHISKQCTKPKRQRDESWFNDKVLLVKARRRNGSDALTEYKNPGYSDLNDLIIKIVNMPNRKRLRSPLWTPYVLLFYHNYPTKLRLSKKDHCHSYTEGNVGVEHTKACYRDEIIRLEKKKGNRLSNNISVSPKLFEVKMNQVLSENERLLAQAIDHDIVKTVVNLSVNDGSETVNECQKCLELKTELLNKKDVVDKETYDKLSESPNLWLIWYTPRKPRKKKKQSPLANLVQIRHSGIWTPVA
ncbi:retrovirus-related pol polyprotein from transposon TNT 1-94 [Tanacetum coccineum]